MALRFAARPGQSATSDNRTICPPAWPALLAAVYRTDGYLVLQPDAQGVAQPLRTVQAAHRSLGGKQEVVLRYRLRADGVRLVTNAFFFPEGQAAALSRGALRRTAGWR